MPESNLRQRAAGKDVAQQGERPLTLADQVKQMEGQFKMAMPKGVEAAQLVRDALTALRTTPKLAECSPATVLGGLMTCAQLGLRPGVLGHAWLVPFWDSKSRGHKAQLVVGYQGLVDLAHRSGRIASLIARTVYSNDTFDVDYGLADNLIHKPAPNGVDKGEPTHYYAVVKFTTGGHAFYVMTHSEMEQYRDLYATSKRKDGTVVGPWRDHFESMAHKTCVRQLSKWMPKSTELATALQVDEGVRVNLDPATEAAQAAHHYRDQQDDQRPPNVDADGVIDGEVVGDSDSPPPQEQPPASDDPWQEGGSK